MKLNKIIIEVLAENEHKRWSNWQKYFHSRCTRIKGRLIISPKYLRNLERLIDTPYSELTELEKDSDREEAKELLNDLDKKLLYIGRFEIIKKQL